MLLFLCFVVAVLSDPFQFQLCLPAEQSQFVVNTLDIVPVKPKGGDLLVVNFTGVESAPALTGGKVDVIVQMGSTILDTYHYDLCDVIWSKCPIPVGTERGTITHDVPKLLLPGWYNLTTVVYDEQRTKEICCVSTKIELVWA